MVVVVVVVESLEVLVLVGVACCPLVFFGSTFVVFVFDLVGLPLCDFGCSNRRPLIGVWVGATTEPGGVDLFTVDLNTFVGEIVGVLTRFMTNLEALACLASVWREFLMEMIFLTAWPSLSLLLLESVDLLPVDVWLSESVVAFDERRSEMERRSTTMDWASDAEAFI